MLAQPQFIQASELSSYGLPSSDQEPNIIPIVQRASSMIDQYLGRVNTDGTGSIVWSTYTERKLLPEGRNLFRVSFKPMVGISEATYNQYAASATNLTGYNTETAADGVTLSPLLTCEGRYGYGRRGQQNVYPDLNYGANILQIASYFGGPPQFTPIDITKVDFDPRTGELWVPAGLYLSAYTEVVVSYNSGFAPDQLPAPIKQACAMLVTNFLSRPATGLSSFGVGRLHNQFIPDLVDPTIDRMLFPYKSVVLT